MTGFTPSNGSKLFIGPAVDTDAIDTLAEFKALEGYVEIKGLKDLASFGDEATAVTSQQLNVNRTLKAKGTFDAGTPGFVVDVKDGDPGQIAFDAAVASNLDFAFYIEYNNKKTTNGQNGRRYFAGQAMSNRENPGAANSAITATLSVGINTPIYKDPAS